MKINRRGLSRASAILFLIVGLATISVRLKADTGTCGGQMITLPFGDVAAGNVFFCSIAEAYFSALTNGTAPGAYSPGANVPREQMAAFITRTMDQSLRRGSNRAALNQYWTTQGANNLALTTIGSLPRLVQSDGADVWVANSGTNSVSRVRASDGKMLETWTGATAATGVLCAMGKVFVTGVVTDFMTPGSLFQIDPTATAGAVTTLSSSLGIFPSSIAYDGERIWTANEGGSVSIITLNPTSVTNVPTGFNSPRGVIFDGANIWVMDDLPGSIDKLHKLDSTGTIVLSADVDNVPRFPAFDGTNIWVPNFNSNTVSVVRATGGLAGTVLAMLSGNGLNAPTTAAFDGERILVTNVSGNSASLWKASDLTSIGTFSAGPGTFPFGACSDGLNFWITLGSGKLARF